MKKLVPVLALVLLAVISCKNHDKKGPVVYKTLNGIDTTEAKRMIKNFEDAVSADIGTKPASYFLNGDMIKKMVTLLDTEAYAGRGTDGFRVYFAKKSVNDLETTLLFVATKDSVNDMHHDYYDHSPIGLLDPSTKLDIITEPRPFAGATLNDTCKNCLDADQTCIFTDYEGAIKRSYAEKMVHRFNGQAMNTLSIWFSTKALRLLIKEKRFSGIRIYLATYPDNTYKNIGRNTVVITTVDDKGVDYFDCEHTFGPPENNGSLCPNNCD